MPTHDHPLASSALDVSRIEHENLFGQVQKQMGLIRQLQTEIHRLQARMTATEQRLSPGRKSAN
jgi:hypothetical protein